jgi:hypothetical protein
VKRNLCGIRAAVIALAFAAETDARRQASRVEITDDTGTPIASAIPNTAASWILATMIQNLVDTGAGRD